MSRKLLAAIVLPLAFAAPVSAQTYSYPVLWPKEVVVNMGFHGFGGGNMLGTNNKSLEGVGTPTASGFEGGLVETVSLDHYTIPPGAHVLSATVHAYGSVEQGQLETSLYEAGVDGLSHAQNIFTREQPNWETPTTWIFQFENAPGIWTTDPHAEYEGWCPTTWPSQGNAANFSECKTRQQQLDGMYIQVKLKKWATHNRINEAYVQLQVELP